MKKICPILKNKCIKDECEFWVQVNSQRTQLIRKDPAGKTEHDIKTIAYTPVYDCAIKGCQYIIT